MNSKITNYVDVLFKGIPNTKKAQELKEEILSNMNEHFEAHLAEGKSENKAYTDSLADLGDIDELLKDLEPEQELKGKIDEYRKIRARNTSISVMLYILAVVFVIGFGGISSLWGIGDADKMGLIGVICMFLCIAAATGLMIYTHMSMPQDVSQYIERCNNSKQTAVSGKYSKLLESFMKLYWVIILAIYLGISFSTNAWHLTWLIWVIGSALKNAIYSFFSEEEK